MSDILKESTSLKTNLDNYSKLNQDKLKNKKSKKEYIFELIMTILLIIIFISFLVYFLIIYHYPEPKKIDLYANEKKAKSEKQNNNNPQNSQKSKTSEKVNCEIGYFLPTDDNNKQCEKCSIENCSKCSGTKQINMCTLCKENYMPIYKKNNNKVIKDCVESCEIGENEKCLTCDKNKKNLCGNCNFGYKLEKGKCILYHSFKAIYNTYGKNESIILINKNYLNNIKKLIIDNGEIKPTYNYTFSKSGAHNVYMLLNANNLESGKMMFFNVSNLISINFTELFNTSNMVNMKGMFKNCNNLKFLNISVFKTIKVTDFSYMFDNCKSLTSIDLSTFNTKNAYDISYMFSNCISLLNISLKTFNTKNTIEMTGLFSGCSSLISIDITNLNTGKTKYMLYMFNGCSSLTSININSFETSNAKDMSYMFKDCSDLKSLDLNKFKTHDVTNIEGMFMGCGKLKSIDLKNFDVGKIKNVNKLFYGCIGLNNIDISCFKNNIGDGKFEIFDEKIGKNGEIIIGQKFYNQTRNNIPLGWKIIDSK